MLRMRACVAGLLAAMMLVATTARAASDATAAEIAELKRDVEALRKKLNETSGSATTKSTVDKALESKYGPDATVTTKAGKLTIGGLLQVWYTSFENDNRGLFDDPVNTTVADTGATRDNDSFRIRRSEIKFTVDIHENVRAVIMIDPAREATSFPNLVNTASSGFYARRNFVNATFADVNGVEGSSTGVSAVATGAGEAPRLLQDAYIQYHGVIPHHDFQIGQFKPAQGEEGIRSAAQLDFIERSFVGQMNDARDLGMQVHGTWWDDRFQYWLGAANGAGDWYGTRGQLQNRSDDNDSKDFFGRALIRPVYKDETWGTLELGYSYGHGFHGEAAGIDPLNAPVNGLNVYKSDAIRHGAWMSYMPGGPVKGMWVRGEWGWVKDRPNVGTIIDVANAGTTNAVVSKEFSSSGWYAAIGYKLSESIFCDSAPAWLRPFEFAARYDTFENVQVVDLANPTHIDNFKTQVWTAGVNYYIKGHNAKIQVNYNVIDNPDSKDVGGVPAYQFHQVDNNSLAVNFQVAF